MNNDIMTIQSQRRLAEGTYEMVLQLPHAGALTAAQTPAQRQPVLPGQFLNIRLEGFYLRRPISICDWTEDTLTIIYKTVGRGTTKMSRMQQGEKLDVLWPLGNGYDLSSFAKAGSVSQSAARPLLIGGGAGVPPMYGLCRRLAEAGIRPVVILGFRSAAEVFYRNEFEALGAEVILTTEDGSAGTKGFVTEAMDRICYDSLFACGPEAMLQAVDEKAPAEVPGQMSFERRMGCGFGACMGCSCRTKYGSKRICVEGPVLERSEIIW